MFSLEELFNVLDKLAPITLSERMVENGSYDNSGILIKTHTKVNKVLFTLDLSNEALKKAKAQGVDTIVTHHPAIYTPIKSLNVDSENTSCVLKAVSENINVISMHLNLDVAEGGIDATLCESLGGKSFRILEPLDEKFGYGREFEIEKTSLSKFVSEIKKNFESKKIIFYGKRTSTINNVASFCGAGSSSAISCLQAGRLTADVIVTSDVPHHVIKAVLESGKSLVVIPHYVAEEKGFKKFYSNAKNAIENFASAVYFDDKRFR